MVSSMVTTREEEGAKGRHGGKNTGSADAGNPKPSSPVKVWGGVRPKMLQGPLSGRPRCGVDPVAAIQCRGRSWEKEGADGNQHNTVKVGKRDGSRDRGLSDPSLVRAIYKGINKHRVTRRGRRKQLKDHNKDSNEVLN